MTNAKKELKLSTDLIISLIMGFLLSMMLTFFIHLFGKHSFSVYPEGGNYGSNIPMTASVYSSGFTCSLDKSHWRMGDINTTVGDYLSEDFTSAKLAAYIFATFEGHWIFMLVGAVIFSILQTILKKYRIRVV